jgi:phosphate starvation-inducible protein PhoH and related proteins
VQEVLSVSNDVAAELAGVSDGVLDTLRDRLRATIVMRGNRLTLEGDEDAVAEARAVLDEIVELVESGHELGPGTVDTVLGVLEQGADVRELFDDVVWRHRGTKIAPKTVTQKQYVEAIRKCTVTFGIGPAGTGKTYLAMALAVAALSERQVGRIILTRPAVEAGERLGFLPGDMLAKVDPYLRPLFDALYDMLDPDKLATFMERGTIEVAPLAFMRGRAQPYFSRVLTPTGWRPIGRLRVGDSVIGSNGQPTRVVGIYPRGVRPVYRVIAQDGASTLCCAEHLWAVKTASDKRRDRPARVLETQELAGQLRCAHQRRFELPLLSEPAFFPPREVPIDPYALGLMLGDGCMTGRTTPTFATADVELADALQAALEGIELRPKGEYDYVLHHVAGGRGGRRIANPVTVSLRELALEGVRSATKFVPEDYLDKRATWGAPRPFRHGWRAGSAGRPHVPRPVLHDLRPSS